MQLTPDPTQILIEARSVAKRFGPVVALSEGSLSCRASEVHALLGANGAGKSTFVKILSGAVSPDSGEIRLEGRPVRLLNPAHAAHVGIATVFQELSLFPQRTVAENILAGREPRRGGFVSSGLVRSRAREVLNRLSIQHISPDMKVQDLSLSDRQLVEICKALSHDPRVLILDEATSALSPTEVAKLFDRLKLLKAQGLAIIFISHRMAEIQGIADRITILRDGRNVASLAIQDLEESAVVELMLGRAVSRITSSASAKKASSLLLSIRNLCVAGHLDEISFALQRGEVVGLTGLEGQGQTDLLLALFGVYRHMRGDVEISGHRVTLNSPWKAKYAGFALIPAERKTVGALLPLSIRENVGLAILASISCFGFIRRTVERQRVAELVQELEVAANSIETPVASLSGGNQQKVVLAKWFATKADVFLFYDPTRGIDIGAKEAVYRLIRKLAGGGKGVLLYSTETEELVTLCDRVLVMDRGRIVTVLSTQEINEGSILRATLGITGEAVAAQREGERA